MRPAFGRATLSVGFLPMHAGNGERERTVTMSYAVDDAALIGLAVGLARTPSVSGHEEEAVKLAASAMRAAGFDTVHIDGSGNAVGAIGPPDGRTIMIDGHIDSIPLHSTESMDGRPLRRRGPRRRAVRTGHLRSEGIDRVGDMGRGRGSSGAPPARRRRGQCLRGGDGGRRSGRAHRHRAAGLLRDERAQRHPVVCRPAGAGQGGGTGDRSRLSRRSRRGRPQCRPRHGGSDRGGRDDCPVRPIPGWACGT